MASTRTERPLMMNEQKAREVLLIFQKNPVLGKVKTRLAKTTGAEEALKIYKQLVKFTHEVCDPVPAEKLVYFSDHLAEKLPETFESALQQGANLGDRMANAFEETFAKGYTKAILIGSDCGEISTDILQRALLALDTSALVLGPAKDGGYYLIGMKKSHRFLFEGISWSTDQVAKQTLAKAKSADVSCALLPVLSDVDTYEDWLAQREQVLLLIAR